MLECQAGLHAPHNILDRLDQVHASQLHSGVTACHLQLDLQRLGHARVSKIPPCYALSRPLSWLLLPAQASHNAAQLAKHHPAHALPLSLLPHIPACNTDTDRSLTDFHSE